MASGAATSSAPRTIAVRAASIDNAMTSSVLPDRATATTPISRLRCIACGRDYSLGEIRYQCDGCSGLLEVTHDLDRLRAMRPPEAWRGLFDARRPSSTATHPTALCP